MRIIFVNRFAFPDLSATSQMLSDLSFDLARQGHDVVVVASRLRYDDANARLPASDAVLGVRIERVWSTGLGRRAGLAGRALDFLSFYGGAAIALSGLVRPGDVVVAKTDPPLIAVVCQWATARRGARLVNWLQDVFPEVAQELGGRAVPAPLGWLLRRLRARSLRRAAFNVAIGQRMADRILAAEPGAARIEVIPNWADERLFGARLVDPQGLRDSWGLQGRFVVGYSGNLGRAHEHGTVLAAAERLRGLPDVVFLFIGGGHEMERLRVAVSERGLTNVAFRPYQPRESLGASLAVADMHWVSLRPRLEGLIVPSKVYGVLAVGRPVLMVGDPQGEVGEMLRRHDCGLSVPLGDGQAMADAIRALRDDPARRESMGRRAKALFERRFTREKALLHWEAALRSLEASADARGAADAAVR